MNKSQSLHRSGRLFLGGVTNRLLFKKSSQSLHRSGRLFLLEYLIRDELEATNRRNPFTDQVVCFKSDLIEEIAQVTGTVAIPSQIRSFVSSWSAWVLSIWLSQSLHRSGRLFPA